MDGKKILVESVVERYLRDISADPRRAIRKLVDLGQQNTKGGFRDAFFQFSRELLCDQDSPYYDLVYNAITLIDHGAIKTMCVNMGYHSWTKGAGRIRDLRNSGGAALPWSVMFRFDARTTVQHLHWCGELMTAGQQHGVFAYSLMPSPEFTHWEQLEQQISGAGDCAFLLFLSGAERRTLTERLRGHRNAILLVNTDAEGWESRLDRLCRNGCMCGIYRTYQTVRQAEEIVSGQWVSRAVGHPCLCAVTMAGQGTERTLCEKVRRYVSQERQRPSAPILFADYYSDFAAISQVIVGAPQLLAVAGDGTLTQWDGCREEELGRTIRSCSPQQILTEGVELKTVCAQN